jgi:hypothetical protein
VHVPLLPAIFSVVASAAIAYHNAKKHKYALIALVGALVLLVIALFTLPGEGPASPVVQELKGCGNTAIGSNNSGNVHAEVKC